METIDKVAAKAMFDQYRRRRDGIRHKPELARVCLICGSTQISEAGARRLVCRSCGFAFLRYDCPACGDTVDGRDPANPGCHECGLRICSCGACGCPPGS